MSKMADKLWIAIDGHIEGDETITNPNKLLQRLLEALGEDTFEYDGWRIERKTGAEMKRRGHIKNYEGFVATHIKTGYIRDFPPNSSGNVPIKVVKMALDVCSQLYIRYGSFDHID